MRKAVLWILLFPCVSWAAGTGELLFHTHCAPCHGPDGNGGRGSNLAVRNLARAPDDEALSAIITQGIPGTQMPGTRMTEEENRQLAAYIRSLGRSQQLQLAGDGATGDRANGERLFWSKGKCGQCHTVGPRGGHMGPDLAGIGARRSPAYLRTSLLDPEADVPETFAVYRRVIFMPDNFLQVRVVARDGRQITGVRVNEDAFTIQIRDYSDRLYSFAKDELRELHKDWGKSPMPGYRSILSESELRDVVAFLGSLQSRE